MTQQYPEPTVGALIFNRASKLFLMKSHKWHDQYVVPGGHIELGETMEDALRREIMEETGLSIRAGDPVYTFEVIKRDNAGRIRFNYVILDLVADYLSGELSPSDDASEARWVTPEELEGLPVSQSTREVLKKIIHFGR